jgi:hypothetical protein
VVVTVLAASAFVVTLYAIALSVIPPDDGSSRALFLLKVVGGSIALIAARFRVSTGTAARRARAAT